MNFVELSIVSRREHVSSRKGKERAPTVRIIPEWMWDRIPRVHTRRKMGVRWWGGHLRDGGTCRSYLPVHRQRFQDSLRPEKHCWKWWLRFAVVLIAWAKLIQQALSMHGYLSVHPQATADAVAGGGATGVHRSHLGEEQSPLLSPAGSLSSIPPD